MTNTAAIHARLAAVYAELADIHGELAGHPAPPAAPDAAPALQPLPRPQVFSPPASNPTPPAFDPDSVNIATHCPKHGGEYRQGNYGVYCPRQSDDPAFSDRKGYCNLPGDNGTRAIAYVNIHKAAQGVR